jgi:hypothetical protein
MIFGKSDLYSSPEAIPASCRTAVIIGAIPILLLGVFIPQSVHSLLVLAAQQLGGR